MPDQPALGLGPVDHVRRRRSERVHHQGGPALEGDVELRAGPLGREDHPGAGVAHGAATRGRLAVAVAVGQLRDVVTAEDVGDERDVLGRDEATHGLDRQAALVGALVASGHDQVDAVRAVADLGLDPVEVDLELLGAVRSGAQHAHPPGLGDRGHDVTAVAERQDRHVDAEHLGDGGAHGQPPLSGAAGHPGGPALLEEGTHALPGLLGGEQLGRELAGPAEGLVDRGARHLGQQPFGGGDGAGAAGQQVGDDGVDLVVEPVGGHGGVDEAHARGLGGGEPAAAQERRPGIGGPQLRQADHRDDRRRHAHPHFGEPELGILDGDRDVHGGGEPHATRDAVPGDAAHVRLGRPGEPAEQRLRAADRRRGLRSTNAPTGWRPRRTRCPGW